MAGVGFKLNKIFEKKTMTAGNLGVLSSPLPVIGPTFFFLIVLFSVKGLLGVWQADETEIHFFTTTFTNISLLAILVSAFIGSVLSPYVSDKVFEEKEADIGASMYGVMFLGSVMVALGAGFMCFSVREQMAVDDVFLVIYFLTAVLLVNVFHLCVYMSTIKQDGKTIIAYAFGLAVSLIAIYLCERMGVEDLVFRLYLALASGLFVTVFLLICFSLRAFGTPGKKCFDFLEYIAKHSYLVWSGLALFVGLFVTNIPQYDISAFSAILIHLPGMALFEIIMRKKFYTRYVRYLSVIQNGTYAMIDRERVTLQNGIRLQQFLSYGIQLTVTLISVAVVNMMANHQGIPSSFVEGFTIPAIGMFFVFCMYDTIIILYYFSGYKEAGIITTVFALTVVLGMCVCSQLGAEYSLLPLPVGGIIGWITSAVILRSRLKNVNAFILCK